MNNNQTPTAAEKAPSHPPVSSPAVATVAANPLGQVAAADAWSSGTAAIGAPWAVIVHAWSANGIGSQSAESDLEMPATATVVASLPVTWNTSRFAPPCSAVPNGIRNRGAGRWLFGL